MTQARDLADGKFDTNTLVVDAANNRVGVGTASPSQTLEISNDGNAGLDIVDSGSGDPAIRLSVANSAGYVGTTTNHSLRFISNDSEVGRFLSGGGLTFNGDTATANALDDYEEGTFTPELGGSGGDGTLTYSVQLGRYTKVGRHVNWTAQVTCTSTVTGGSGTLQLKGLPYTAAGPNINWFAGTIGYFSGLSSYGVGTHNVLMLGPISNGSFVRFHCFTNQGDASNPPTQAGVKSDTQFYVGGAYEVS